MYKLQTQIIASTGETVINNAGVLRTQDSAFIPSDPANTDFQKFKNDVLEGAELQDAEGNVMTQEEAVAFIDELP